MTSCATKTLEFRAYIAQQLSAIDEEIQGLRDGAHDEEDLIKKEQLFNEIDEAIKDRDKQLELVLKEILPEAFAVCREAARRFKENPTLEVTATEHDRNLAAKGKRYISIEGEKATWKNQWTAAGGEITWDMVHYDVQLVGGMVLHDGKVAEMATGEGKNPGGNLARLPERHWWSRCTHRNRQRLPGPTGLRMGRAPLRIPFPDRRLYR